VSRYRLLVDRHGVLVTYPGAAEPLVMSEQDACLALLAHEPTARSQAALVAACQAALEALAEYEEHGLVTGLDPLTRQLEDAVRAATGGP
jgi:hypothetical protein